MLIMTSAEVEEKLRQIALDSGLSNGELEEIFGTLRAEFEMLAEDDEEEEGAAHEP